MMNHGRLMTMGLSKKPTSLGWVAIQIFAYSALTSGAITGVAAWHWKRQPTVRMQLVPRFYYEELEKLGILMFWVTFAALAIAMMIYRTLRDNDALPPKDKVERRRKAD